jgi:hypothetical protein
MPSAAIRCVPSASVQTIAQIAKTLADADAQSKAERAPPGPQAVSDQPDTLPRRAAPPGGA